MKRTNCLAVSFLSCLPLLLPAAGCGDSGPELGEVSGTVTLDGKPLPKATIEFQPESGSPSYGETDENGHYELMYALGKPGAMVGRHVVRITTERMDRSDPTPENPDGELISYPEILPAKYHAQSELEREVKPGSQTINFPLKSK